MSQLEPERVQFTSADGLSIACVTWSGQDNVRGVVQTAHGLGEHIGRYVELAETLVHGEFVVYGNDHRGHGLTAKASGSFGDFGPGGFDQLVEDMASLAALAKHQHPGKPYILLGHSMGSFAAQQFILDYSHSIDGLALSGSGTLDGLVRLAQSVSAGEDPMNLMNAPFEPARTPLDWLSRDNAKWMPSSLIRFAFRRLRPSRWSPSRMHPRGFPAERDPQSARGSSHIHFLRQRRSRRTKIGRSACAHRPLSQRGNYINRSRFLSRRSARNAARTKSPRGSYKSTRLDLCPPARVSLYFLAENRRMRGPSPT